MIAWIPSRWVDEHETALYKQRGPLSIQVASIWLYSCNTASSKRGGGEEREQSRESYLSFRF